MDAGECSDDVCYLVNVPDVVFDKIFSYLCYEGVAKIRIVCRRFNEVSQRILNRGFYSAVQFHSKCFKEVKSQLPRRESKRPNHPLARHNNILNAIETRLSLLKMTYCKYIHFNACCFIPGKVVDELFRVLHLVNNTRGNLIPHEILTELRDISSMAMDYFEEKIVPTLRNPNSSPPPALLPQQNSPTVHAATQSSSNHKGGFGASLTLNMPSLSSCFTDGGSSSMISSPGSGAFFPYADDVLNGEIREAINNLLPQPQQVTRSPSLSLSNNITQLVPMPIETVTALLQALKDARIKKTRVKHQLAVMQARLGEVSRKLQEQDRAITEQSRQLAEHAVRFSHHTNRIDEIVNCSVTAEVVDMEESDLSLFCFPHHPDNDNDHHPDDDGSYEHHSSDEDISDSKEESSGKDSTDEMDDVRSSDGGNRKRYRSKIEDIPKMSELSGVGDNKIPKYIQEIESNSSIVCHIDNASPMAISNVLGSLKASTSKTVGSISTNTFEGHAHSGFTIKGKKSETKLGSVTNIKENPGLACSSLHDGHQSSILSKMKSTPCRRKTLQSNLRKNVAKSLKAKNVVKNLRISSGACKLSKDSLSSRQTNLNAKLVKSLHKSSLLTAPSSSTISPSSSTISPSSSTISPSSSTPPSTSWSSRACCPERQITTHQYHSAALASHTTVPSSKRWNVSPSAMPLLKTPDGRIIIIKPNCRRSFMMNKSSLRSRCGRNYEPSGDKQDAPLLIKAGSNCVANNGATGSSQSTGGVLAPSASCSGLTSAQSFGSLSSRARNLKRLVRDNRCLIRASRLRRLQLLKRKQNCQDVNKPRQHSLIADHSAIGNVSSSSASSSKETRLSSVGLEGETKSRGQVRCKNVVNQNSGPSTSYGGKSDGKSKQCTKETLKDHLKESCDLNLATDATKKDKIVGFFSNNSELQTRQSDANNIKQDSEQKLSPHNKHTLDLIVTSPQECSRVMVVTSDEEDSD